MTCSTKSQNKNKYRQLYQVSKRHEIPKGNKDI